MNAKSFISRTAMIIALASPTTILAQTTDPQADSATDGAAIIVTGTRLTGMRAVDSPAPIQLLSADTLHRTGSPDLMPSLAQKLPSVQAQSLGGDLQRPNLQRKLRGMGPNQTLIIARKSAVRGKG